MDAFDSTEKHFGLINYEQCCIYINRAMPDELQKETIFHEFVHGVLLHIGEEDKSLDEKFVQTLSNALYQTFGKAMDYFCAIEEKRKLAEYKEQYDKLKELQVTFNAGIHKADDLKDIVRCGECKYADHKTLFCTLHSCNPTESDYCSWGERE